MIFNLAPNVAAASARDAARLFFPTRRLLSKRRVRKLAATESHEQRDALLRMWSRDLLEALDLRIEAGGLEHVGKGPFIVMSLHESLVDVPVLIDQLRLPLTFVARAELERELPIKGFLEASGQILIRPEAPDSRRIMLRGAAQMAAQGRSVAIFPQGSVLGIETAFRSGLLSLAQQLDLPVLPVALWGAAAAWQYPFSPSVRRGVDVRMEVLEPRRLGSAEELRVVEREMKQLALADSRVVPRRYVPERDGFWDGFKFEVDSDFAEVAAAVAAHRESAAIS